MIPSDNELLQALAVPVLCLLAGVVNTLFAMRLARTPRQKVLLVRFNIVFWAIFTFLEGVPLGLVGAGSAPKWILIPSSVVFVIAVGWAMLRMRRRLLALRLAEMAEERRKEKEKADEKLRGRKGKVKKK